MMKYYSDISSQKKKMGSRVIKIYPTYHQFVGDLGDDHAKGEQVETGVVLKQVAGRLLENDEGQGEDEADVQTRTQHAGVLQSRTVY